MRPFGRVALAAVLFVGIAAPGAVVRGQVLNQVPEDALAVLRIRNLNDLSRKSGRIFKDLNLDAVWDQAGDPLGWTLDEFDLTQGVDRNGDLAVVLLDPDRLGGPKSGVGAAAPAGADSPAAVAGRADQAPSPAD